MLFGKDSKLAGREDDWFLCRLRRKRALYRQIGEAIARPLQRGHWNDTLWALFVPTVWVPHSAKETKFSALLLEFLITLGTIIPSIIYPSLFISCASISVGIICYDNSCNR